MTEPVVFPSQLGPVMGALVDLAAVTLEPGCAVLDGPVAKAAPKEFVVIGTSDLLDSEWISATADQEWSALGARTRSEEADIFGVSVAWTGDAGRARPARDKALANIAKLEQALRTGDNITLGLAAAGINWAGIAITQLRQVADDKGIAVWASFTVRYRARLQGVPIP